MTFVGRRRLAAHPTLSFFRFFRFFPTFFNFF